MRKIAYSSVSLFDLIIISWWIAIGMLARPDINPELAWQLAFIGGPLIVGLGMSLILICLIIYYLRQSSSQQVKKIGKN